MVPMPNEKSKIFLLDDHPLVRSWLGQLIEDQPDLMVCGEADNLTEAWSCLKISKPDVAILDLSLPDGTALELIKNIKVAYPSLRILVLSMHEEKVYAGRVIRAGAHGYVMKRETAGRIIDAIYEVLRGKLAVSDAVEAIFSEKYGDGNAPPAGPHVERLSNRELEIFELIGTGMETRSIARQLQISMKTVQTHCAKIQDKLELDNATELLREAIRWREHPDASFVQAP
jgi:DNA-binding NarL/FixJ family response regulator